MNIRHFGEFLKKVESWFFETNKETDNIFIKFQQTNEILTSYKHNIEKVTRNMIGGLRENTVLWANGYELFIDNEKYNRWESL